MNRLILVFLILFSFRAQSIDFEDTVFPELATSGRALAMGNAFISKVDDSSAVFYNPAGLGTVRYPHLHLSNFAIETNKGLVGTATSGTISDASSNISNLFSLDGMRKILKDSTGTIGHSRIHALPNFTARYFSMGFLFAKRSRAVVNNMTATGLEIADRTDIGPYAALNLSLFGGVIKLGASGIILNRKEIKQSYDPNATLNISADAYSEGTAAIVTSGAKLTLPITFLPTFSATMHNSLKKKFSARKAGAPTTIPSSIDVGFSITPQIGTVTRVHLEANYKDISGASTEDVSATRKLLLGMELDFNRTFFFRFGYGDGFGSAGLGVRTKKLEFDLTTYAVDTTSSTFRGKEDRRFVIGISTGF